jgi:hypothetical protein
MQENFGMNIEGKDLILSDRESSDVSSGTAGSFFDEEDQNLIENKELYNKQNMINGSVSFVNKFEFMKNSNCYFNFYINNTTLILIMNIISLIFFLFIIILKLIIIFYIHPISLSNQFMIYIIILFAPFLILTLLKTIWLYKEYKNNNKESENKDLIRLLIQKWNIYYSISLILLSINFMLKIIILDILKYYYKMILILDISMILIPLIILGIIYYFTKSNKNILIINYTDIVSFPLSISVLFSFAIINFVDQFNNLIYISTFYCFLLTCISLLLLVYYNDILFSFLILIYQMGGIKKISFYSMNFHLFCTLMNLGFTIFMFIKNVRNGILFTNDENNYKLIEEKIEIISEDLNE